MITNKVNFFQKTRKHETRIGKAWGVDLPWCKHHGIAKSNFAL